jgi:hypothetical protein
MGLKLRKSFFKKITKGINIKKLNALFYRVRSYRGYVHALVFLGHFFSLFKCKRGTQKHVL